jgi:hypothetical protein
MPDLIVDSFGRGLDMRRMEIAAYAGSLSRAINCHITAGGEIEKRLAFVQQSGLLTNTYGLAEVNDTLTVFGSGTKPATVPSTVTYQRLQYASGTMTAVLDWDHFDGKLYVAASYSDGTTQHFYDGTRVTDWFDGKARGQFTVSAGSETAYAGIQSVKVNGVEILSVGQTWTTTHANTASKIAAQINSFTSSPEYTAIADGGTVVIIAENTGTAANGLQVSVEVSGTAAVSNVMNLTGGATGTAGTPGDVLLTFKNKMHVISSANDLHFSAVYQPIEYNEDADGAGFLTPSNHDGGAAEVNGLVPFVGDLGIFARESIQIWHIEADDTNNELLQVIGNAGTTAGKSVCQFRGMVPYLDGQVIRALKRGDGTDGIAEVDEFGAPIDTLTIAHCTSVGTTTVDAAVSVVEPRHKRLMMAIGNRIYVYSYFPKNGVAAWTEYEPGFTVDEMVVIRDKLYLRSGTSFYLYGGDSFSTYDSSKVTVRIPFLDAARPNTYKDLQRIGVALEGLWTIKISTDPNNASGTLVTEAVTAQSRVGDSAIPAGVRQTHIMVHAENTEAAYGRISQFVLSYLEGDGN